jgi:hypothetical protein
MTDVDGLKKLREPFPANQVGKLPKGGMMLDFVGHGWLTQRLLDVDPEWNWEPFSLDDNGLPKLDDHGGLWIRLTVCGVTRIGYGEGKGAEAVKIAIGDALRNAGMRFGLALDLWCKGDPDAPAPPKPPTKMDLELGSLQDACVLYNLDPSTVAGEFFAKHKTPARSATVKQVKDFVNSLHDKHSTKESA